MNARRAAVQTFERVTSGATGGEAEWPLRARKLVSDLYQRSPFIPALPYRNLGKAHRRLTGQLPPDAPCRATGRADYFAVIADLWCAAGRTGCEDSAMPRWHPESRRT